jgi:hypothetical protein
MRRSREWVQLVTAECSSGGLKGHPQPLQIAERRGKKGEELGDEGCATAACVLLSYEEDIIYTTTKPKNKSNTLFALVDYYININKKQTFVHTLGNIRFIN